MDRRDFVYLGLVGVGGSVIAPRMVIANMPDNPMAGGVYYTKGAPGRWSKKVGGHLPSIELNKAGEEISVQVVTGHEMKGYEHYIIKHQLLDKNFAFLDEHMFDPMKDKLPISTFSLTAYRGPLYAISMCNKHDTWLNVIDV
jgi:superoxide reductase